MFVSGLIMRVDHMTLIEAVLRQNAKKRALKRWFEGVPWWGGKCCDACGEYGEVRSFPVGKSVEAAWVCKDCFVRIYMGEPNEDL